MKFKDALIKCLSDSGEVSYGRAMSAIAFLACILWDTSFVVYAAHKLDFSHMGIHDILPTSDQLWGQVVFCAACYSISKFGEIVAALKGNKNA